MDQLVELPAAEGALPSATAASGRRLEGTRAGVGGTRGTGGASDTGGGRRAAAGGSGRSVALMVRRIVLGVSVPIAVIVVWETIAQMQIIPTALLPSPQAVVGAIGIWAMGGSNVFYSGLLLGDLGATLGRVLGGFALAAVVGVGIGVLIGRSRIMEEILLPTLRALGPVPPTTWIPIAIVFFGLGEQTNIALTFIGAVFPVVASSTVAVLGVDRTLLRAGRMMGYGTLNLTARIVVPAALPGIVGGLQIGLGLSWMMAVTSEMLAVHSGLGYTLWNAYNYLNYPGVFAAMVVIGLCGLATDILFRLITRPVLRWHVATGVRA
ncbi:MAG: binding-protein-dependent transport system inner rane component [Subtercola sp.]|nr:binding-protein-dependent transport system inner rane component [Subtercola sp.]